MEAVRPRRPAGSGWTERRLESAAAGETEPVRAGRPPALRPDSTNGYCVPGEDWRSIGPRAADAERLLPQLSSDHRRTQQPGPNAPGPVPWAHPDRDDSAAKRRKAEEVPRTVPLPQLFLQSQQLQLCSRMQGQYQLGQQQLHQLHQQNRLSEQDQLRAKIRRNKQQPLQQQQLQQQLQRRQQQQPWLYFGRQRGPEEDQHTCLSDTRPDRRQAAAESALPAVRAQAAPAATSLAEDLLREVAPPTVSWPPPPSPGPAGQEGTSRPVPEATSRRAPEVTSRPAPEATTARPAPEATARPVPVATSQPAPEAVSQPAPEPAPEATARLAPEATTRPAPEATTSQPAPEATARPAPEATSRPAPEAAGVGLELGPELSAAEVAERCRGCGLTGLTELSGADRPAPVAAAVAPAVATAVGGPARAVLRRDQLAQKTPSVLVRSRQQAHSRQLQEFCLKNPVAVVRGISAALGLDLGLFSTKTLVEAHPDHAVEIRSQVAQGADQNWDRTFSRRVWGCVSSRSRTTIARYAQYQAVTFSDSLRQEKPEARSTPLRDSDSDSRDSFTKYQHRGQRRGLKLIKFGTNVDLSDERKWRPQLHELTKLPAFCRVVSAGNMLSHVGHPILGMNTVQLYMKVPGSRTPGHQENNNFCSININIGPGDCEWFCVPDAYWTVISELCQQKNISYLHGSWWPDVEELLDHGVPVYRFMQRPGDLVWVNTGCVHWVQAAGWCNNIAWNVGPLTARQHRLAVERYEWNKLERFKSIVPVQRLSWNLARNIRVSDRELHRSVRSVLLQGLRHVLMVTELARSCGVDIRFHGRGRNESTHYCGICEVEVFGILFVKANEKRHVVFCVDCSWRQSEKLAGFLCLEEYKLQELMDVYDNFVLHAVNA